MFRFEPKKKRCFARTAMSERVVLPRSSGYRRVNRAMISLASSWTLIMNTWTRIIWNKVETKIIRIIWNSSICWISDIPLRKVQERCRVDREQLPSTRGACDTPHNSYWLNNKTFTVLQHDRSSRYSYVEYHRRPRRSEVVPCRFYTVPELFWEDYRISQQSDLFLIILESWVSTLFWTFV